MHHHHPADEGRENLGQLHSINSENVCGSVLHYSLLRCRFGAAVHHHHAEEGREEAGQLHSGGGVVLWHQGTRHLRRGLVGGSRDFSYIQIKS
jgi:hypothetical protein